MNECQELDLFCEFCNREPGAQICSRCCKMIRIIVNFYILKSAKKLKMPTFITAIVAKTYFGASFLTNFVCFAALKNF